MRKHGAVAVVVTGATVVSTQLSFPFHAVGFHVSLDPTMVTVALEPIVVPVDVSIPVIVSVIDPATVESVVVVPIVDSASCAVVATGASLSSSLHVALAISALCCIMANLSALATFSFE